MNPTEIRETEQDWMTRLPPIEVKMRWNVQCRVMVSLGDVPDSEMIEARSAGKRIGEA